MSLLALPAELRNEIYRLVLGPPPNHPAINEIYRPIDRAPVPRFPGARSPFVRTCRQIRAEALSLYYSRILLRVWLRSLLAPIPSAKKFSAWMGSLQGVEYFPRIEVSATSLAELVKFRAELVRSAAGEHWWARVGQKVVKMGYFGTVPATRDGEIWVGFLFGLEE